jgi:hypothetical protein
MQGMTTKPESLAEAHQEIYRLVELLHHEQQKIARLKRSTELLARVPVDLAKRLGPELIKAMAESEGEKAACEEAARQQRDLPRLLEEFMRRAEARQREAVGGEGSVEHGRRPAAISDTRTLHYPAR